MVTSTIGTSQSSPESTGVAKLESKESINEIKDLRNELSLQQTRYYELQGTAIFNLRERTTMETTLYDILRCPRVKH